jgi:hypothetical protein
VVDGGEMKDGVAPVGEMVRADFYAVWVGSYLDKAPADRAVAVFQKEGYTAFTVRKTLEERRFLASAKIGDFHLVLVGLFGRKEDAEVLGRRLVAQGLVTKWQVLPSDDPGELHSVETQTAPLLERSESVVSFAQEKAGKPLPPDSPAVTGAGFQKAVYGRYVGSFRDPLAAKKEASRLSAAGWPAAVEESKDGGGLWYRVYLAESKDPVDFRTPPAKLEEARTRAMSQPGMVLLLDTSGLRGVWGAVRPDERRLDASACAGYSQAGRMLTGVERLVGYIPDNGMLVMVRPLGFKEADGILDRVSRPIKNWWKGDDSSYADTRPGYGPAVYNRPEVLKSVRSLKADPRPAPLAPELLNLGDLKAVSGRKTVVLFSDFRAEDKNSRAQAALSSLKSQYGGNLDFIVVYGDSDDQGYRLAQALAGSGGGGEAWNACRLLADNGYFANFVKRVFRR